MVSELAKYDFGRSDVDAKGAAYQEIVGTNLRVDRGQYFTPRSAIKLMVEVLDPKHTERVFDPACGTGGFLIAVLDHLNGRFHAEVNVAAGAESTDEFISIQSQCIATYPGDFAQALMALDADLEIIGPAGVRSLPFSALHRMPGGTRENQPRTLRSVPYMTGKIEGGPPSGRVSEWPRPNPSHTTLECNRSQARTGPARKRGTRAAVQS